MIAASVCDRNVIFGSKWFVIHERYVWKIIGQQVIYSSLNTAEVPKVTSGI